VRLQGIMSRSIANTSSRRALALTVDDAALRILPAHPDSRRVEEGTSSPAGPNGANGMGIERLGS
jgi:hypothetical protein